MKKIIVILLALTLVLSFAACTEKDSATKIKQEYQSFDWENAMETQRVAKAKELIARIDKLPAAEQQELTEIKNELKKIADGSTAIVPSPSPSPIVTPIPSPSPIVSPTVKPIIKTY
ncbi:MAG: hypothetical protein RR458_01120 [Clostridia bacterium]